MAKGQDLHKSSKKKPAKTMKEKRQAKKAKKALHSRDLME